MDVEMDQVKIEQMEAAVKAVGESTKTWMIKRNAYWASLRTMKIEYSGTHWLAYYEPTDSGFGQYVRDTYGIRIQFDHSGNITADYTVEDEKLYLVYLIKHGR